MSAAAPPRLAPEASPGSRSSSPPRRSSSRSPRPGELASPPPQAKDFSYLLRPEIYLPLGGLAVPPPFRAPARQPPQPAAASSPAELLAGGHFTAAAIA